MSTAVSGATRDVLLETASFDAVSVRRTARRHALHSESSYRFERIVDPQGVEAASTRAAALVATVGEGRLIAAGVDRYPRPSVQRAITLTETKLRRLTGVPYKLDFAADALGRLGFKTEPVEGGLRAAVPTFRPDVVEPEDLIEEVLRLGEYSRPAAQERIRANARSAPSPESPADRVRDLLAAAGLHEVVTWGFVAKRVLQALSQHREDPADAILTDGVTVQNPMSEEYEVMRTSLLPGLMDAMGRNLARGAKDLGLFEVGTVVRKSGEVQPAESTYAAGMLVGKQPGWLTPGEPLDFFDIRGVVEVVLHGFGATGIQFDATHRAPFLHPGVSAGLRRPDGSLLGCVGEIDPRVVRRLGVEARIFYFELCLGELGSAPSVARAVPSPRFPEIARDISFWIDAAVPAAVIREALLSSADPLLRDLAIHEDFRDPQRVPAGKKGMLWSMTYRADDHTLTDEEADAAHARVVGALSATHNFQVR
jgi:phenylalanyl-tRNA synthetase beta chain